jgi:hypothetical protein
MSEPLPNRDNPGMEANIQAGAPPMPAAPLPTVEEPIAYRPISGWAIAGFAAGALFSLLTLLCTIVALSQGAPMFLPIWVVGVALVGIVLSLVGQHEVQNSEGTRAGAKLARAGLWLSVISGLCYLSYYFATGLAVESQANDFLLVKSNEDSGFFPRLREGADDPVQLNHAFLLTLPGNQRSARPDNEESMAKLFDTPGKDATPGNLSAFKHGLDGGLRGILPSVYFKQNAKDIKIEPGAVQEWKYEQKSYQVRRIYRLESKEVVLEMSLLVASTEAEAAGQGRKWHLVLPRSAVTHKRLTRYGEGLAFLRHQARVALEQWIVALNQGQSFDRIKECDKTDWENARPELRDNRAAIYPLFQGKDPKRIERFQVLSGGELGKWEEVNGKIRIYHDFRFGLPKEPGRPLAAIVDAWVAHETEKDINPAEISADSRPSSWNLMQIGFTNFTPLPEKKGLAPGG